MDKLKNSILRAAADMAANMRVTADRLECAANARDFRSLSEIGPSTTSWTLDAIRGAATAVTCIYDTVNASKPSKGGAVMVTAEMLTEEQIRACFHAAQDMADARHCLIALGLNSRRLKSKSK